MSFWQEVTFGVLMLITGLAAEWWIDVLRDRYVRRQRAGKRLLAAIERYKHVHDLKAEVSAIEEKYLGSTHADQ